MPTSDRGGVTLTTSPAAFGKPKSLGSGGSEPAEGSLSKRTEAPRSSCGGVAGKPAASRACRGQDAPVEALDKAQVFHGRRVPSRFSSDGRDIVRSAPQNQTCDCFVEAETINDDGSWRWITRLAESMKDAASCDTLSIRRSERELRPRVNPGTTPASGSSEKQSRVRLSPGANAESDGGPVSPPSRRSQQGSGTRSDSAAAAESTSKRCSRFAKSPRSIANVVDPRHV
ncbi:unnamed protein product [Clavelina lepadiformis]|uniref:Uncharacterized protein n=1 Tax=Clavelina lepadiformis TaxID=159417 RepID=A0ABP0H592_CLALP